jgi:DNA modification methylase
MKPKMFQKPKAQISGVCHEDENGNKYEGDCWAGAGTSIFDPVLCELSYRWFAPAGGKILDPFAGGSVRGIVAEKLGYKYTGIELRQEQIDANEKQAEAIGVAPRWINGDSSKLDEFLPLGSYDDGYDMIFTCPPYYDLEEYSENKADGSAKQTYAEFLAWYAHIFGCCVKRLKWNRFVVIVVGEIRDENGFYRNFVGDTITTMLALGLRYYNEAILVTSVGSLPLRVNAQFGGYRKLGKTHQNMVCFYNGSNCDQIKEKFGELL